MYGVGGFDIVLWLRMRMGFMDYETLKGIAIGASLMFFFGAIWLLVGLHKGRRALDGCVLFYLLRAWR